MAERFLHRSHYKAFIVKTFLIGKSPTSYGFLFDGFPKKKKSCLDGGNQMVNLIIVQFHLLSLLTISLRHRKFWEKERKGTLFKCLIF